MDAQIVPQRTLTWCTRFNGNFVEVNYSTKSDVCGLIFAEITTSRRTRHVISVAIFRAQFLAPGSFVSLTDVRFRKFQLSRCIYEERGNDVARVPRCNFLPCVSSPSIAIAVNSPSFVRNTSLPDERFTPSTRRPAFGTTIVIAPGIIRALSCFNTEKNILSKLARCI